VISKGPFQPKFLKDYLGKRIPIDVTTLQLKFQAKKVEKGKLGLVTTGSQVRDGALFQRPGADLKQLCPSDKFQHQQGI